MRQSPEVVVIDHLPPQQEQSKSWHILFTSNDVSIVCLHPRDDSLGFSLGCGYPEWRIVYQDDEGVILKRIGESDQAIR
ncbi:MAG: hypothetical protein JXA25_18915 [Anaerolineales bacterium]|nr:hypothetical protein [Anaerolineales bacterium]